MTDVFELQSTVEQWDRDYYQPIARKLYDRAIGDMLRMMAVPAGATILDAGCGPGVHSVRAAKAGLRVCAIDISNTMLEHAKRRVAAENVADRVELSLKDITRLDFEDGAFQYAFSWGVLIHIPDAERGLDELARIVAPGGKLALYLTNRHALDHKIERVCRFVVRRPLRGLQHRSLGDGVWYGSGAGRLWVWQFDASAICAYLRKRGFRLIRKRMGELSDIQRRMRGPLRNALLHLNNVAYRCNLPARPAAGQLLIFEKSASEPSAEAHGHRRDRSTDIAHIDGGTRDHG